MRRLCFAFFVFPVLLAFAACGSAAPTPQTSAPAASTPVPAAPSNLYFTSYDQKVGAVDPATGALRWSVDASALNPSGRTLAGSGLVFVSGSAIAAYNAKDGSVAWQDQIPFALLDTVVNGVVYADVFDPNDPISSEAAGEQGVVYALDAKTGKTLWQVKHGTFGAAADNTAYVTYLPDGATSIGLAAINVADGSVRWAYQPENRVSFWQAANGQVYAKLGKPGGFDPGTLVALNAKDGKPLWSYPQSGTALLQVLDVTNDLALVVSNDGNGDTPPNIIYGLSTSDGSVKWRWQSPEQESFGALLDSTTLYTRWGDSTITALNISDGSVKWNAQVATLDQTGKPRGVGIDAINNRVLYASVNYVGFFALDAATGVVKWKVAAAVGTNAFVAVKDSVAYASAGGDNGQQLLALNISDGSQRWQYGDNLQEDAISLG